uniref:Peptidase_M13_N domain-containing protein n=1 Tax=Panagrellus redivivus TaxID=6233 RepID=A0A7E4URR6_PANRE
MSVNEGSYQKLQNEDTLSTVSFYPPLPKQKSPSTPRSWAWIALFITVILVLLLKVAFLGYVEYYAHQKTGVVAELEKLKFNPVSDFDFDESCFSAKPTSSNYEDNVAELLHKALVSSENPKGFNGSVPLSVAKISYKTCLHDNQKRWDLDEMIETVNEHILENSTMEEIANTVALFWSHFNVETFFKFSVKPNFYDPESENRFLIYVEPNADFAHEGTINPPVLDKKVLNLRGRRNFQQARLVSQSIKKLAEIPVDSSDWQVLSVDTATGFDFDFKTLFKVILQDQEKINYEHVKFVITNPEYVQNLGLLLRTTSAPVLKELFMAQLQTSFQADFDDCVNAINKYLPQVANVLYMDKLNDTEVRLIRQNFITVFDLLTRFVKNAVAPYLSNEAEVTFIRDRLDRLGLSTEVPDYLQMDVARVEFDKRHKGISVTPSSSWLVQLLRFRRFDVSAQLEFLTISEVLRDMAILNIPQTSTKITYSRMGNWLAVPVAAMMRYEYSDRIDLLLEIATELVRSVDSDSFKWASYGVRRVTNKTLTPEGLIMHEKCFAKHSVAQIDYPVYAAANATFNTLVVVDPSPFASGNLANDILEAIVTYPKTISRERIATAWAVRNNMESCNTIDVLNCFREVPGSPI